MEEEIRNTEHIENKARRALIDVEMEQVAGGGLHCARPVSRSNKAEKYQRPNDNTQELLSNIHPIGDGDYWTVLEWLKQNPSGQSGIEANGGVKA